MYKRSKSSRWVCKSKRTRRDLPLVSRVLAVYFGHSEGGVGLSESLVEGEGRR